MTRIEYKEIACMLQVLVLLWTPRTHIPAFLALFELPPPPFFSFFESTKVTNRKMLSTNNTALPTSQPTPLPTAQPTLLPSSQPNPLPSAQPTALPTSQPTPLPTGQPTPLPSSQPTPLPSAQPTALPTPQPTPAQCFVEVDRTRCDVNYNVSTDGRGSYAGNPSPEVRPLCCPCFAKSDPPWSFPRLDIARLCRFIFICFVLGELCARGGPRRRHPSPSVHQPLRVPQE